MVLPRLLVAIVLAALVFAAGCETAAQARARKDLENSRAAYERCLWQNLADPSPCEALKRAYEVDSEIYRQTQKAPSPNVSGLIESGPRGSGK